MKLHNVPNLRKNYLLHFEAALIVSLGTFIGLFKLHLPTLPSNSSWTIPDQPIAHLEGIIATTHSLPKPEPPPVISLPQPPPKDEIIEDRLQNLDIEFPIPEPIPLPAEEPSTYQNQSTESFIEDMPQLIGGLARLQKRIEYPTKAIKDNVQGRVIVQFIVDEKGFVRNPTIIKGVREDLNNEAIKAILKARFLPGRRHGLAVPVEQVIYILFRIEEES